MTSKLEELKSSFLSGKTDRRGFMRGATALGLSVAAATQYVDKAQAATPKKGGRLRQAITGGATSDSLEPATYQDAYMINVGMGQLRNNLTEIAADGSLIGELAESWEATPDAASWTFKLRPGVEFHDGKSLEASDVAASIQVHLGEDSKSAAKGIVQAIENIKVEDESTVTFELSGGNADFPYLMSDYHLGIAAADSEGKIDWSLGNGTGGYKLSAYEPGVRTFTTRNPNYWKEGAAHFDEVETLYIADVAARTSALQTNELDIMTRVDLKTVHLLKREADIEVLQTTGNQHVTLPMLMDVEPFTNNDLRLALKYAIDREQWLKTILKGYGILGNDFPIGPANQFRATEEEIPQRVYDPDKAKHHLKKAGYDTIDLKLHLADTAFEGAVDAGQLYAETARPAGINIEVVREPNDGYWSNVWGVKPWCASYWGGRPTEDWMFSQVYATGADWNETHMANERFMELLVMGRAELDPAKRREIYVEMQRIVRDEGGNVIPFFNAYVAAMNTRVKHSDTLATNWELDGHKNAERWWFG